jgi:hypothetical protein
MGTLTIILVGIISVAVALTVGWVSSKILERQKQLAQKVDELAGILGIRESKTKEFWSLAEVLTQYAPKKHLRILAVSGESVFKDRVFFENLLRSEIKIDILLLDPTSTNPLYERHKWLLEECKSNLKKITDFTPELLKNLSVRLYPHPLLEMLMFIDGERLFLSSYFPITDSRRLIYEIQKAGEKSLYNLYDEAIRFIWDVSYPVKGEDREGAGKEGRIKVNTQIQLRFPLPSSVTADQIKSILLASDSGLQKAEDVPISEAMRTLKSEIGTLIQIGLLVVGSINAAKSLYELVQLIKSAKKSRDDESSIQKVEARTDISIIINNTKYNIADLSEETIRRLLEK